MSWFRINRLPKPFSIAAIGLGLGAAFIWLLTAAPPVPGPLSAAELQAALVVPPLQTATARAPFAYKDFRLTPRADYDITAVVFSTKHYYWNFVDRFYRAAAEDLALGWGPLGDYKYKDILHIRQEYHFFKYRWRGEPPFPREVMIANMANTHIIPANAEIAARLGHIQAGDIVHLTGALVDVTDPGHGTYATSLTRTDTGPGACEILWLESVQSEQ